MFFLNAVMWVYNTTKCLILAAKYYIEAKYIEWKTKYDNKL